MSKQPPEDDSLLEAIFSQLQEAMSDNEYGEEGQIQEELLEGIRHSLEALFGGLPSQDSPTVTVVEGGKSDDEPRNEQDRPNLAFAPEIEAEEALERPSDVQVRILKGPELFSSLHRESANSAGQILLNDDDQQTLFKGTSEKTYRIFCSQGRLSVHCLGQRLSLQRGQSVDVEASEIAVSSVDKAKGHYFRVTK